MSYFNRTLSYLKRNGIRNTYAAVMERLDKKGMDRAQKRAKEYIRAAEGDYDWSAGELLPDSGKVSQREDAERDNSVTGKHSPLFSILVPAYETDETYLRQMIDSVLGQTYAGLELILADASPSDRVKRVVQTYVDDRIVYHRLSGNAGISENTNVALSLAQGDFIGLLDHDDLLHREALMEMVKMLDKQDYAFIYTDEDKVNEDLTVWFEPNFKPDFNLDYLLSNNYICHFAVMKAELMKKLRFRPAYDGAQDYDLFLRAVYEIGALEGKGAEQMGEAHILYSPSYMNTQIGHIKRVLYHWRAHGGSTADNPESKRYAYEAGKRALTDFAARNGWAAKVSHTAHLGFYEMTYLPDIFAVRADVAAVCGRKIRRKRVVKGPLLGGEELFLGMKAKYSGYMHRAAMKLDVDSADEECLLRRPDTRAGEGRIVYLPDFRAGE